MMHGAHVAGAQPPSDRCSGLPQAAASASRALYFAAPVMVYLAYSRRGEVHHDIWHQMALLRESTRAGHLLTSDPFSYAATLSESMQHEWGAGALALMLVIAGGSAALMFLKFALMIPVVVTTWLQARRFPTVWPAACALGCLAAAMVSYSNMPVCAQTYSVALFSILLWCLSLDHAGGRLWMALFLPLFVVWVNLHGGFAVGLLVLAAYGIEQALRRRPWVHIAAYLPLLVACVAFNPYGVKFYANILLGLTMQRPIITEWKPFWAFTSLTADGVVFVASLLVAAYAFWKVGPRRFEGALVLALLAVATIKAEKVIPLYALAWFSVMLGAARFVPLARAATRLSRAEPGTILVVLVTLVVVSGSFLAGSRFWQLRVPGIDPQARFSNVYPVGPVEYLRTSAFRGNVMTPFDQGAFVSWKLYPAVKVGCDSRYEVAYDPRWVEEVHSMYVDPANTRWAATLVRYPTDLVLVDRLLPLAQKLSSAGGWQRVYRDDMWELYARPGLSLPQRDRSGEMIEGTLP